VLRDTSLSAIDKGTGGGAAAAASSTKAGTSFR
jgi:hypothetical protein